MTSRMKRVAFADSPDASASATDHAVFANRTDEVLTAGGMKPAGRPDQRADEPLIKTHTADQQQ